MVQEICHDVIFLSKKSEPATKSDIPVANLCKEGKIAGAIKIGKSWQIPDYVRAQSEYYYVDKTLLIRDFLDQKPLVSLFTRPRRFGKI